MSILTGDVVTVDESKIHGHVEEVVRASVEETLNGLLDAGQIKVSSTVLGG